MPQGIITKGIGGFYYVNTDGGILECKARGKFRNEKVSPLVGDMVEVAEQKGSYVIDRILPRKNELIRPQVANVDQVVIVFAAAKPDPNLGLLDKFLLLSEYNNLKIVICINKIDLKESYEIDKLTEPYRESGHSIISVSTRFEYGIDNLRKMLNGHITVFAGPSGVGKSTILNTLQPSFNMETGELSSKISRGKNTTRHTQLLELDTGGYVVDTPGFSSLNIDFIDKGDVEYLFHEFKDFIGKCKFTGCSHISEPGCAVKDAVINNIINKKRYDSYVKIYCELKELRRNYK